MDISSGSAVIRRVVKDLPPSPGVYRMVDAKGGVLYVGKAKNLKNRVSNYINDTGLPTRIMYMVSHTAAMEIITTRSEAEALLLEANLIKRFKPKYNILLRDDKSFPFICIGTEHEYPQLRKHRGARDKKNTFFGPYPSAHAVNHTLAILQRIFLLRSCPDTVFKNRTRPCLQYQIKRCSAPCVSYVSKEDYAVQVEQAKGFLSGKSREIQEQLARDMERASAEYNYEQAAHVRDRIRALTRVQSEGALHARGIETADCMGVVKEGGKACVQVLFIRSGQNFGSQCYFPIIGADSTPQEILSAFIGQFYQAHTPPKEVITSHALEDAALLEEALNLQTGSKIYLVTPERGEKKGLVEHVLNNASAVLARHLSENAAHEAMLEKMAELFGLMDTPKRIEVYDNSHISGTNAIGAFIVATPEGFNKKAYRTFSIKENAQQNVTAERAQAIPRSEGGEIVNKQSGELVIDRTATGEDLRSNVRVPVINNDDYAMMREVLSRRFTRLQKEDPEKHQWPDVILIDGGAGQHSAAQKVLDDLGVTDIACIAIAKGPDRNAGREEFHMRGREPFRLPPGEPLLHYLQRLRDEAHRFAIGTHRDKRSRTTFVSELDAIPNIGPTRKKALLHHFGSARAVEGATLEELQKVPGVNATTARAIFKFFHE